MEEILLYFSLKYAGDFDSILKALECKEKIDEKLKKELFKDITANYYFDLARLSNCFERDCLSAIRFILLW